MRFARVGGAVRVVVLLPVVLAGLAGFAVAAGGAVFLALDLFGGNPTTFDWKMIGFGAALAVPSLVYGALVARRG